MRAAEVEDFARALGPPWTSYSCRCTPFTSVQCQTLQGQRSGRSVFAFALFFLVPSFWHMRPVPKILPMIRAYTDSGNETISYTAAAAGTLHIMVHGYEASSFTLVTSAL